MSEVEATRQKKAEASTEASTEASATETTAESERPQAEHAKRSQFGVLTRRYLACTLGDPLTVLVLVAQAPFIGFLCTLVWGDAGRETPSLYFVMALSSIWFGCINACREIVKERAILERERFFGLSLPAYVGSKFAVLAGIGLAQVFTMQMAIEWSMSLRGPFLVQTLAMWGASICGMGLGLLVSALSKTQERAVGVIPLLILPQILFSEVALRREWFPDTMDTIENFMPAYWAFDIFQELAKTEPAYGTVLGSFFVLFLYAGILGTLATAALIPRRET
ncbi:MAG: ABC transporter permease [Proteobacteria bacterium]|nr:ABC transporter permease [Pseudomonadota bacterium]MCP4918424.1 ABC transporter permease [Pseudomonadota bacterium]